MTVTLIGSGNVATHLAHALKKAGFDFAQVFSRNQQHAQALADQLACGYTTQITKITPDADIYIFSVKDDVLQELIASTPTNNGLWIHTAGSMPIELFKGYTNQYGVLYPLQTFSKTREIDFSTIPCFIEANSTESEAIIYTLARSISENVQSLNSEKRKHLHLAAVFACNFSNHMYTLASKILKEQGLAEDILLPLINETAAKVHTLTPNEAQTGPAVRFDRHVMDKQLALLSDPTMQEIYQIISKSIHKEQIHE